MLKRCLMALVLAGASGLALAGVDDPAALARFDVGYQRCEQLDASMRGQRDSAWLALWRTRADDARLAKLAKLRQGEAYQRERKRFLKASANRPAASASSPIAQQCEALHTEQMKAAARAVSAPASAR